MVYASDDDSPKSSSAYRQAARWARAHARATATCPNSQVYHDGIDGLID
jgi:hypothetical protein